MFAGEEKRSALAEALQVFGIIGNLPLDRACRRTIEMQHDVLQRIKKKHVIVGGTDTQHVE